MLLVAISMVVIWRQRLVATEVHPPASKTAQASPVVPPKLSTRLHWIVLAFVPSSLLLGVTAYLSSDVSPVPLIWVVPLALYLLSFMLVFSRLPEWVHRVFAVALPLMVLIQIYHLFNNSGTHYSMQRMASIHLLTFFSAAMVCHGELARRRPTASFLTEYYFWLSLGGVLGGLFNAIIAPLVFNSLAEYPIATSMACLLSPLSLWRWPPGRGGLDVVLGAVIGLVVALILFLNWDKDPKWVITVCLLFCVPAMGRPVAFGSSALALFAVVGYFDDVVDQVVWRHRDFYGVLQVHGSPGDYYYLSHGRIRHGRQSVDDDAAVRNVPQIYYFPSGPIGQVFSAPAPVLQSEPPIAVIGLGVGSLASYGRPGQELTFYEIDPAVERIARDDRYFTYLRDSKADCRVILGDARLSLRDAPNHHYGLIVIDAFSGDAIPVHLLTHEAMQLYLDKLALHGLLALHVSNQFLDLAPVLGNLSRASSLVALDQLELFVSDEEKAAGKTASHWIIVARTANDFGRLAEDARWQPLVAAPELPLWTDHHTSLWGIANWRQ
jgi:hypothetical protein